MIREIDHRKITKQTQWERRARIRRTRLAECDHIQLYREARYSTMHAVRSGPPPATGYGASGQRISASAMKTPTGFLVHFVCFAGSCSPGKFRRAPKRKLATASTLFRVPEERLHGAEEAGGST